MATYIPVVDPLTPTWLTAVLRDADVLRRGEVTGVDLRQTGAFNSSTSHLTLAYSSDASAMATCRIRSVTTVNEGSQSGYVVWRTAPVRGIV